MKQKEIWKLMLSAKDISAAELNEFTASFDFDRRLFDADIRISLVYCGALFHAGVLTRIESERIKNGLHTVLKRAEFNRDYFTEFAAPDIFTFVEKRLVQLIGEVGEKLNIGRSRNDRSAAVLRFWMREEIVELSKSVRVLQSILINSGETQKQAVLPAYEHLNKSQPILWAHWCLAYFEMLARDRERLDEVWRRVNVLPLGSGGAAGTSLEIDREEIARDLGFEGVSANSLDAVTDADYLIELVGACALIMIHLSRLAEDLILYQSAEYDFIEFSTMLANDSPAAQNLNVLELVRGKASLVFGHQTALSSVIKNLPIGIYQDTQAARKTVFGTVDLLKSCLKATRIVLESVRVNEKAARAAATGYQNSELIDYLTQREVSPKIAREVVNRINELANSKNEKIIDLSLEELRRFSAAVNEDVFEALSLQQTLANKNQIGGTAPERVYEALDAAKENLARDEN